MNVNTNSSVVLTSLKHEYDPLDPQILLWMDLTFFFYIWQKKGLLKIKYREVCGFSRGVTIISKKDLLMLKISNASNSTNKISSEGCKDLETPSNKTKTIRTTTTRYHWGISEKHVLFSLNLV